jgi:glycosidase
MHIIIDWVANHTSWDNVWTKQHPNWYEKDSLGNYISPYDWTDVISLDYENKEVWKGMQDAMIFWLENTNIDGFRCDVADLVPLEFWNETRAILDAKRPVFMLAEAETPALQEKAFDMTYAWELHHIMNDIAKQKKNANSLIDYLIKQDTTFESSDYRMIFTTNHDENSWNGTTKERLGDAKNTFAALTYFLPGMPLIYSGQEAGLDKRLKFFNKDEIDWSDLSNAALYKKLNSIKHNNSALWNGNYGSNYSIIKNNTPKEVFSISRYDGNNTVFFIVNLSPNTVKTTISFKDLEGEYTDALSGNKIKLSDKMEFNMGAWDYRVILGK